MRQFLTILTLAILVRIVAAAETPPISGRWKVVSVNGDYESYISDLRTMTFDNGRVEFQSVGIWAAKVQIKPRADGTRQLLLDGPPELNGGDLSNARIRLRKS